MGGDGMIMAGRNVRQTDEQLIKIKVEQLYYSLRQPKQEIVSRIRQLRILKEIDEAQYRQQKSQLPYFVCGMFNPPYRRKENFAYTEYFIIDIDHVSSKGIDINGLRLQLQQDSRVVLCFVSPSEDGLKVMFRLDERCYEAGIYSVFYKAFAKSFSSLYNIDQIIDSKTCDVSRACFISIDPEVYYNPNADPVSISNFISHDNTMELFDMKSKLDKEAKNGDKIRMEEENESDNEPDKDTISRIKDVLKLSKARDEKPDIIVPKILDEITDELKIYIEKTGAIVASIKNIQYAKQIQIRIGLKVAEINLFYGKRGFSVVKSTKSGTDAEMNDLASELVQSFINSYGT